MTVRWKPLIVLTGLFLVVAAMGLLAFAFALPRNSGDLLKKARGYAKEKRFDYAQIQYRQALQADPKNAAILEEMADVLETWGTENPPKDPGEQAKIRLQHTRALADAAKYGKGKSSPRRKLLADALERDDPTDALTWADELIVIEAKNPDANYVKGVEALDRKPPDLAAARERLDVLASAEPKSFRTLWLGARLAEASGDDAALEQALETARTAPDAPDLSGSERLARLRLRLLDVLHEDDAKVLADRVKEFGQEATALAASGVPSPTRVRLLSEGLERVQKHVASLAARDPKLKPEMTALGDSLESVGETIYSRALETLGQTDLRAHLAYAEHLIARDQPEKAIEVATNALKLDIASIHAFESTAAGLREAAIKAALARDKDPERFAKAEPFIAELIASPNPRYVGMGHFFRGLIALDRSNLTAAAGAADGAPAPAVDPAQRDLAVSELRLAAAALPESATAQALYGVSLILTGEAGLGRQYLQAAYRLGGEDDRLEPRYQVWAAWSILQAGYPEEAEPILEKLQAAVAKGDLPPELSPTLHMLRGEAHEARGTPAELKLAREEFQKAIAEGQAKSSALQLRLAQLDFRLKDTKSGAERLATLKADPKAGAQAAAAADRLSVQALVDAGKPADAARALADARKRFPDSDELAELDATMKAGSGDAAGAEATLAKYLAAHPGRPALTMVRARLLAGPLGKPDEARALLVDLAKGSETSGPLVQLALLDLQRKDYQKATATIAEIRGRWKESATADLLDAQVALGSGNPRAASVHLDNALGKDPNNKVALFWKALLDERNGGQGEGVADPGSDPQGQADQGDRRRPLAREGRRVGAGRHGVAGSGPPRRDQAVRGAAPGQPRRRPRPRRPLEARDRPRRPGGLGEGQGRGPSAAGLPRHEAPRSGSRRPTSSAARGTTPRAWRSSTWC